LFYDFTPKRRKARPQFAACCPPRTAARTYDHIHRRQFVLMQPKRLTDRAADSIAFYAITCHFDRYGEAEAGPIVAIELQRDAEQAVTEAPAARMNSVEIRLAADASLCRESVSNGVRGA
jgi:hypothetical protein